MFDRAGDDVYSAGRIALGSALFGVGLVWDVEGDDRYFAEELSQGAAFFGAGFLVDLDGDDLYAGARLVQGFAGPDSMAALFDAGGDDRYFAGAKHASSYSGDDRYVGGNFSQGIGYYLGVDVLQDDHGDDDYLGARYAQGAAAHLGIGTLLDGGGDDRYRGKTAANQGAAWDLSIATLIDCAGNDDYGGGELALGSGEQNGIAWFFKRDGSDTYGWRSKGFGFTGATTYEEGRGAGNLGVFIDSGGDKDVYPTDAVAADNHRFDSGNLGLFSDR